MTEQTLHWLVATDLDGTLLDESYDYDAAAAAIDVISADNDLIVILASSKTLAEMLDLAERCESRPLLVFENGAGMAWHPERLPVQGEFVRGGFQVSSRSSVTGGYEGLRTLLHRWRCEYDFQFTGFADYTSSEVAEITGLSNQDAGLAKQRLYTEPLIWQDSPEQLAVFQTLLAEQDLTLVAGGRFLHVMPHGDKAATVSQLRNLLQQQAAYAMTLLACGDADNDLGMLELAEIALVFPDPAGGYLLRASQHIFHARRAGAAGWRSGVTAALHNYPSNSLFDNATDTDQ